MTWDVAVIGAGPAGCAAAIELSRAGKTVALLDKAAFPRDKLCGEFISPEAIATLHALGCSEAFFAAGPAPIRRAAVIAPSGARVDFEFPAPAWGLSRLAFDKLLVDAACAAGAELIEHAEIARAGGASPDLRPGPAGGDRADMARGEELEARDGRRFRAAAVVLAAGRHSLLQPAPRGRAWFAFKAHYEGECGERVELYFFPGGYCGLAPVEGGRVNVCALIEKRVLAARPAEQVLSDAPALRDRLSAMRRLEPFLHTGPVVMGWRQPPPGLLPAGDAALFVDPFTGDGMSVALWSGCLAARHLIAHGGFRQEHLPAFLAQLRQTFGRQVRASRLLRSALTRPWLEFPLRMLFGNGALRRAAFHATRVKDEPLRFR